MTREEMLACLEDRPCNVCKYHTEKGCKRWACVFEEEPDDTENKRESRHGHWLEHDAYDECSACLAKKDNLIRGKFNFCPNCGADMREPEGEEETE